MTFVRTVLGDIDPAELGVTYAHEHLVIVANKDALFLAHGPAGNQRCPLIAPAADPQFSAPIGFKSAATHSAGSRQFALSGGGFRCEDTP